MLRVFDWSSKTRNDVACILSGQPVSAMGCYTGTIFNAKSLQIVSLKIVQCDIILRWLKLPKCACRLALVQHTIYLKITLEGYTFKRWRF